MFERKLLRADEVLIRVPKKTGEEAGTKEKKNGGRAQYIAPLQNNHGAEAEA